MKTPQSLYERIMAAVPPQALPRPRVRPSAAIIPWREGPGGDLEVFWVERSRQLSFMAGFRAFPGGGLSKSDVTLPLDGEPQGLAQGPSDGGMPAAVLEGVDLEPLALPGLVGCAVRELFEETGVLVATGSGTGDLNQARDRLLGGEVLFNELAAECGWRLDAGRLVYAGRWLTPRMGPMRFDNRFFLLEWDRSESRQPRVCGSELTSGEWIRPTRALARWREGEILTAPPILHILTVLADLKPGSRPETLAARLRVPTGMNLGPHRRIEFRPGVLMFPLPTPTLPPASHTNTYVLGTREVVLVDPGTPFESDLDGLLESLRDLENSGFTWRAIWLTHHHSDHVGGVERLRRELGIPVCAHPETASRLAQRGLTVDEMLRDGERVVLAGERPFPVRIVHTPGHARGHLAFLDETFGSLLVGDLVAGTGTVVINPPEGNLDQYLASLAKVKGLGARTLFPAHGPPTLCVEERLEEYLRHRQWREQRVLDAWQRGLRGGKLLRDVYSDVSSLVLPLAARQLEAHLERLRGRRLIDG